MPELPSWIESLVVQTDSYESGQGELAHTSAATVAESSTTAPPVSVVRKSCSGAARFRAHAVRSLKLPRFRAPSATDDAVDLEDGRGDPRHQCGVRVRGALLSIERRPIGSEGQRTVGYGCAAPPRVRAPYGGALLTPVDICVDHFVKQSLVDSFVHRRRLLCSNAQATAATGLSEATTARACGTARRKATVGMCSV